MNMYYAQPYTSAATGFYFENPADYAAKIATCIDDVGNPVEEFEIQVIDGTALDVQLFEALSINQATIVPFMEQVENWLEQDKHTLIIAVGECGYPFDITKSDPGVMGTFSELKCNL